MSSNRIYFFIVLVSFLVAVALGMADRETESLVHLFTAETGNLVTMGLITAVLSTVSAGWAFLSKRIGRTAIYESPNVVSHKTDQS